MKDELGDRMKSYYEDRTRIKLPRNSYTIIRIDGKAFHTYTNGLKQPFDDGLISDMDETASFLCKNIQGAKFAFVQSDEISILLTDFTSITTDAWFDGNLQKMCSVSASMAAAQFNSLRIKRYQDVDFKLAFFDARVFQIPSATEVENYFIWRQQDTTRNSIQSVAQSLYSQKQLHGKNTTELQSLILQKNINWNDYAPKYKRGRLIVKQQIDFSTHTRAKWVSVEPDIFTQNRLQLQSLIPRQ